MLANHVEEIKIKKYFKEFHKYLKNQLKSAFKQELFPTVKNNTIHHLIKIFELQLLN